MLGCGVPAWLGSPLGRHGSDFLADGVGVVATIGEQCLGLVRDHAKDLAKALQIMCLARRHDEAEWSAFAVAARVELGGEAAPRSASA